MTHLVGRVSDILLDSNSVRQRNSLLEITGWLTYSALHKFCRISLVFLRYFAKRMPSVSRTVKNFVPVDLAKVLNFFDHSIDRLKTVIFLWCYFCWGNFTDNKSIQFFDLNLFCDIW